MTRFPILISLMLGLSACAETSLDPDTGPPAITRDAAEAACLRDVARDADAAEVAVLGSEVTDLGTMVRVAVGPSRTPWSCMAYGDDTTGAIMSIPRETAL